MFSVVPIALFVLLSGAQSLECPKECKLEWNPVVVKCKATGATVTFINACTFNNYLCKTNRKESDYTIVDSIKTTGVISNDACATTCSTDWIPVCLKWRKDGTKQTFTNQCIFNYYLCRSKRTDADYEKLECPADALSNWSISAN